MSSHLELTFSSSGSAPKGSHTFFDTVIYPEGAEKKVRSGKKIVVWLVDEGPEMHFFENVQEMLNRMDFRTCSICENEMDCGSGLTPYVDRLYGYSSQLQLGSKRHMQILSGFARAVFAVRKKVTEVFFQKKKVYAAHHAYMCGRIDTLDFPTWFSVDYDAFETAGFVVFRFSKEFESVSSYKRYNPIQNFFLQKEGNLKLRFGPWLLPRINAFQNISTEFDFFERNCQDFFLQVWTGKVLGYSSLSQWPEVFVDGKAVSVRELKKIERLEKSAERRQRTWMTLQVMYFVLLVIILCTVLWII